MKTSNDTIKTLKEERKQLRSNFKETCKHGNNNNKIKAKVEYLNCQSKLRNEIGKEETKGNDDKLMTLIPPVIYYHVLLFLYELFYCVFSFMSILHFPRTIT